MSCGKCGGVSCLCPVSLGIALGVTSVIAMVVWVLWGMYQGAGDFAWWPFAVNVAVVFVKSFIFGFVLALIYDFIVKKCKGKCCRSEDSDR